MTTDATKLAITVHHNDEVTVKDERGYPNVCLHCRFSGWLTEYERQATPQPVTCLFYSGGADSLHGDRVIFDDVRIEPGRSSRGDLEAHNKVVRKWRETFPQCWTKNRDGNCQDFVKARPLPWWGNFWLKLFRREWRTRKMRL